jgi:thioredoxin 1
MIASIKAALRRLCNDTTESADSTTPKSPSAKAALVTDDTFEQTVLKSETPVLVDFFASWCGPCQAMAPKLDQLAQEYDGKIAVLKVDTDVHKRWGRHFEVKNIPTLIYFNKGKVIHRTKGNLKIETLRADCNDLLKKAAEAASE